MANLAAQNTIDTANTDGNCIYGAEPLGGKPQKSANVKFNQMNVEFYWSGSTSVSYTHLTLPTTPYV